jgi:hypothetical protein
MIRVVFKKMAYGKGRATSYGDYYASMSKSPDDKFAEDDENTASNPEPKTTKPFSSSDSMVEKRKAALRRRLKLRKAGN